MAEFDTMRARAGGISAAQIDEGLRAHMNKVYATMSVGLLVTAGAAWGIGTSPAMLAIFRDPYTLQPNILGWIVMLLALVGLYALLPVAMKFASIFLVWNFEIDAARLGELRAEGMP